MVASKKFFWIGCAVAAITFFGVVFVIGPKRLFASTYTAIFNDSKFAPGFSNSGWQKIKVGDSEATVVSILGNSLSERETAPYSYLLYTQNPVPDFEKNGNMGIDQAYTLFTFDADGALQNVNGQSAQSSSGSGLDNLSIVFHAGVSAGFLKGVTTADVDQLKADKATRKEIEKRFGSKNQFYRSTITRWLNYSESPSGGDYDRRRIGLDSEGTVVEILAEQYFD